MLAILVALLVLSAPLAETEIGICHLENEKDFRIAHQMGFKWHRGGVAWASIQIKMWGYDCYWKDADEMVNNSIKYGVKMIWPLAFTPWWCSSKPNASYDDNDYYTYPPKDMNAWYDFVKTIATRYKGKITAWEIWNEEDTNYFWKGSVEQFVELMKYAYIALKEVDENNTVIMGGLALANPGEGEYNPHFLEEFLAMGGGKYVDVYAFHVYNNFSEKYDYMKKTLEKFNENKPLWITEFGASTCGNCHTQLQQALTLISYIEQFKKAGIEKAMIYEFKDTPGNDEWESHLGIFTSNYFPKIAAIFIFFCLLSRNSA
ncbi:MAG: hypothetical protein J7K61_04320 [Thermoplasmata archaeon]|nr:hypothetical protein [Thermoplasmata archaeon]